MADANKSATIKRKRASRNFTMICNQVYSDGQLSYQAMGLLSYLLSKPDDWEIRVAHLEKVTTGTAKKTGRDGVYKILKELIERGFCKRHKESDGTTWYEVSDYPKSLIRESRITEKPDTEKPDTPNTTLLNTDLKQNTDLTNPSSESSDSDKLLNDAFDIFWQAGMRKVGKQQAFAEFKKATEKLKQEPFAFARMLASDVQQRNANQQQGFDRLHPERYIKHQRWTDELVIDRGVPPNEQRYEINGFGVGEHADQSIFPEYLRIHPNQPPAIKMARVEQQRQWVESQVNQSMGHAHGTVWQELDHGTRCHDQSGMAELPNKAK
ncbi:hypothetical protein [Vibrio parahaemolyticus]|uniref:hypothetical protein n=1 Tax=Vibrio parahaemolyticus TaxID=670 RepID=UPI0011105661|nr:hypothetical protein [Vibrio parahaemolyticus]TMX40831.1 hypothetical protein DA098_03100 [Vibrio parahaemolyticus]TMX79864.1 hypothetical protein DA094_05100 [Vibrio parahaemolyticus]